MMNKIKYQHYENIKSYDESMRDMRKIRLNSVIENESTLESKDKIIKILEIEYEDLERQQSALIYSNDEMFAIGAYDTEMIEARAENMKYIDKNIKRMKEIKEELIKLDESHFIRDKDVLSIEPFRKNQIVIDDLNKNLEENIILNEIEL